MIILILYITVNDGSQYLTAADLYMGISGTFFRCLLIAFRYATTIPSRLDT